MPDLIDVLRGDHATTLELIERLLAAPHQRSEDQLRVNEMTQEMVMGCSGHEVIEEMHFWPAVRKGVPGGADSAAAGLEQERRAKWILHHLNGRTPGDNEYDPLLVEFATAIREHIAFEQAQVWPAFLDAVDPAQRDELGQAAERDKRLAPTRPHPGTPSTPGVLGSAGRLTGLADRALDVVTGRGRRFAPGPGGVGAAQDEPRRVACAGQPRAGGKATQSATPADAGEEPDEAGKESFPASDPPSTY